MKGIKTILIGIFFIATASSTVACSCDEPGSIAEGYKNSDIVVNAKVISSETIWLEDSARISEQAKNAGAADTANYKYYGYFLKKITVRIIKLYKGVTRGNTLTVYTASNGTTCGFKFLDGGHYLIYGSKRCYLESVFSKKQFPKGPDIFWTHNCTRTQIYYQQEAKELEKLSK